MADLATTYTITGTGSIVLNQGTLGNGSTDDLYWISAIRGLDGPVIRAPVDDVPFGDGGLVHSFWKGPRRVTFEGNLIAQSAFMAGSCQEILNGMEQTMKDVLASIISPTFGTLTWTPTGQSAQSLSVSYEIGVDFQPSDNFHLRSFTFGLVSGAADPS